MTPAKKRKGRSAANKAADRARAAGVRKAWAQAREYAERHGTRPTLAKRLVPFELTNASIRENTRKAFVQKKRLRGGKRASEAWGIPKGGAEFRLVIRRKDGGTMTGKDGNPVTEVRSDSLRISGGASIGAVQKAMRNAVFGVVGADLAYEDGLDDLHVEDDGEMYIGDDELELLLEPDDDETPFAVYADDDDDGDDGS